jgi:hypothetical protein
MKKYLVGYLEKENLMPQLKLPLTNSGTGTPVASRYGTNSVKQSSKPSLPEDDSTRANYPLADGLLDYFPNALAAVAEVSKVAGDKHHPGEPMHWERGKSMDHRNKIVRHLIDSGKKDKDGNRHSAALAWRALALLQEELEAEGAPPPRNAVDPN